MKNTYFQIACFSLSLIGFSQVAYSATIQPEHNKIDSIEKVQKSSVISKALLQQKYEKKFQSDNSIKVITEIKAPATQSVLAAQNQSFSRFIQNLFS